MNNINRFIFTGRLTKDPELRSTNSGMAVLGMRVAFNSRRRNGERWEDHANFIDVKMFGSRAEKVYPSLEKGTKVMIEGKLNYHEWKDKDTGRDRNAIEVIVDEFEFESRREQPPAEPYAQEDIPF